MTTSSFPQFLMIQTTTRCNAACIFCPYPTVAKEIPHREMSFTLFRKLMNECSRHTEMQSIMLFLMNEPLMDPLIVDRINYAKELNPDATVVICTNGCNLDPPMADRLIASGLDQVTISIHAQWPATYRRLTGRGDFDRVQNNVAQFVKLRNRRRQDLRIDLRLIGAQQFLSEEEVSEAEEHWRKLAVDEVEVFLGHTNRAGNLEGTYQIVHRKVAGCGDGMAFNIAAVVSNGDMVLCCMDWRREVVLGNVMEQSIQDVWSSPRRQEVLARIRGERPSEPDFICKRCMESVPG